MTKIPIGTYVICRSRMPSPKQHQPELHIGIVRFPGSYPFAHSGSPAGDDFAYCRAAERTPVEYTFGLQFDTDDSLLTLDELPSLLSAYDPNIPMYVTTPGTPTLHLTPRTILGWFPT